MTALVAGWSCWSLGDAGRKRKPPGALTSAGGRFPIPDSRLAVRHLVPSLQLFDLVENLGAVEQADVAGLRGREATNRPAQVHEMRLDRVRHRVHSDLARQSVRLARVTGAARRHDVAPVVRSAARERYQVIPGQGLA